jgi:protease-4
MSTSARSRAGALTFALALGLGVGLTPREAAAAPEVGERRSTLRDLDHPSTIIAGEADGAATVMNPSNLGFLRGVSGVLEGSVAGRGSLRRGSGVGAFLGIPLGLKALGLGRLVALGLGYQVLFPKRIDVFNLPPGESIVDARFHKLSFALAVPLERWVRGLSVGLAYGRLFSRSNPLADGVNQLDLAMTYRAHERVALGLVARGLNAPRMALGDQWDRHPIELDPEIAVRPLGTRNLELGVGGRIIPMRRTGPLRWPAPWQPRARASFAVGPIGLFSEAELLLIGQVDDQGAASFGPGMRWIAGLSVDLRHVGVAGGPVGGLGGLDGGAARLRVSAERYDAPAPRPREVTRIRLADFRGDRKLARLVELLEALPAGSAIAVETRGMSYGWAQAEELREALMRLRERGGEILAYLEGASLGTYYVASAADRIVAHPQRRLGIVGVHAEVYYFGELLEKLGARGEFLRIAEFKARPETYERASATAPVAAQRELFYGDLYATVVAAIAGAREVAPEVVRGWVDAAPLGPDEARTRGLIDALAYADELDDALEDWLERPVKLRAPSKRPEHAHALGRGPEIAVVHVDGILRGGASFKVPLVDQRIAGAKTLTKAIAGVRKDPRVRAVVVRIDSIGGSVAAAAAITRELELTAAKKPVIVSFGNIAASGGYYVATAGSVIFTDALTSTGSIGIFRPKVDLSGFLSKLGVGVDRIQRGAAAGIGAWTKPYSEAERAAALAGIEASYRIFTERVAAARGLDAAAVDAVARGRIWRGVRALDRGLADHDGGLYDALVHARALLGRAGARAEVIHLPAKTGLKGQLAALGVLGVAVGAAAGEGEGEGDAAFLNGVGVAVLGPFLPVLRRLPLNLWLTPEAEELAMVTEVFEESV